MAELDVPMVEARVSTSAGTLYAKQWGERKPTTKELPIVLLHDSLGCVELWRDFPLRLVQAVGCPVIAYDRLGFGHSDAYPGVLEKDFIRQEALGGFAAIREQFQVDRFVVFGHSVGGGMAVSIASAYPNHCCGVITEAAQAFIEDCTLEGIRVAKKGFADPSQFDRLRKYHGENARWVLDAWTETWLSPKFADWTLDNELRQVRCPLLAIHGDQDEYGTVEHPHRITSLVGKSASFTCLEGCGHVPHREQEQAVLQAVRDFMRELTA